VLTDSLIIDYINRFLTVDMSARVELFDFRTTYQFQTTPGICQYNMPLYSVQAEPVPEPDSVISFYPVYQGFKVPCSANGIHTSFYTDPGLFYNLWPNYVQSRPYISLGDGGSTYTIQIPFTGQTTNPPNNFHCNTFSLIPGHLDITGIINCTDGFSSSDVIQDPIFTNDLTPYVSRFSTANVKVGVVITATAATGKNIIVQDSGFFLNNGTNSDLYGLLYTPGPYPSGNLALTNPNPPAPPYSVTSNTVNYNTGLINVNFLEIIPVGNPINVQVYAIEQGIPRALMFFNNTITMLPPPNTQYLMELTAYLTPAAFLSQSQSIPFSYMSEYIVRGSARKILSDTGDWDQFNAYEPLFIEQERNVWKRSQRQFTSTRTDTIFSNTGSQNNFNQGSLGT